MLIKTIDKCGDKMDGASKVVGLATLSAFGRNVTKSHKITSVSDNVSLLNHIKSVFCQIFRKPLIQLFLNIAGTQTLL